MRLTLIVATSLIGFVFAGSTHYQVVVMNPVTDFSSQRVTPPTTRQQIACTATGCRPIPPGCTSTAGQDWDGNYSGYDRVVCP